MSTLQLEHIEITRRAALAGLGLGGAAALAGCQLAVDQQSAAAGDGKPTYGGTLEAAIPDDLIPSNLFTNSNTAITSLIGLVYESLIRYPNDKVVPQPRLATSWHLAPDGRTLTLRLRKGVVFHSGRPFTSKDVAFSIHTYGLDTWSAQMKSTAQAVSVDSSDPHVAVLHLDHPMSNIFDLLDTVFIIDRETADDLPTGKNYVGTGPFEFESWTPNASLTYKRSKRYWRPGRPYLDTVRMNVVPDATSIAAQVRSGQVQFAEGLDYRDAETLGGQTSRFHRIRVVGAEQQIYVGANVAAEPLNDVRVRQAIAYSIDRERIISDVFRGSGYPINLPWPKYSPAYDEELNKRFAYDPKRAKELVAEVGRIPTIPYTYNTASPAYATTAQIVQSNLADVGISVELDPVDPAQFVKQLIGAQFKGLWTTLHSWAQFTPSTLTVSAYPFNALHNASHYDSPTYVKDANAAWTTRAGARPAVLANNYEALNRDLLDALFLIEIGVVQFEWVTAAWLHDVSYTKRWELDLTNAYLA